jgi:hypothetical protein
MENHACMRVSVKAARKRQKKKFASIPPRGYKKQQQTRAGGGVNFFFLPNMIKSWQDTTPLAALRYLCDLGTCKPARARDSAGILG